MKIGLWMDGRIFIVLRLNYPWDIVCWTPDETEWKKLRKLFNLLKGEQLINQQFKTIKDRSSR